MWRPRARESAREESDRRDAAFVGESRDGRCTVGVGVRPLAGWVPFGGCQSEPRAPLDFREPGRTDGFRRALPWDDARGTATGDHDSLGHYVCARAPRPGFATALRLNA